MAASVEWTCFLALELFVSTLRNRGVVVTYSKRRQNRPLIASCVKHGRYGIEIKLYTMAPGYYAFVMLDGVRLIVWEVGTKEEEYCYNHLQPERHASCKHTLEEKRILFKDANWLFDAFTDLIAMRD